jgi:hypothetical protein
MGPTELAIAMLIVGAGIFANAAYGGVSVSPADFRKARVCFVLSAMSIAGVAVVWGLTTVQPLWVRVLAAGLIGATASIGLTEALRWLNQREQTVSMAGGNTSGPNNAAPVIPTSTATPLPPLHRHYEEEDRKRLSAVLFDLYTFLNENVSPLQVEVHKILRELPPHRVRSGGATPIKARLSELRTAFAEARDDFYRRFKSGSHYYADEIEDITSNKDELMAELIALDKIIAFLGALPEKASQEFVHLMEPYQTSLRDTNFDLGSWVGRCNERIKTKRDALR